MLQHSPPFTYLHEQFAICIKAIVLSGIKSKNTNICIAPMLSRPGRKRIWWIKRMMAKLELLLPSLCLCAADYICRSKIKDRYFTGMARIPENHKLHDLNSCSTKGLCCVIVHRHGSHWLYKCEPCRCMIGRWCWATWMASESWLHSIK